MSKNRTDADCTLWYCPQCGRCGVVTMDTSPEREVFRVIRAIKDAHRLQSPECPSDQRVVRPESWYKDVAKDLELFGGRS